MQNKIMANKPRVLCFHGFRASSKIFEFKIRKSWPDTVLEKLDLHFLDGPLPARGKSDAEGFFDPPYYEWFEANLTKSEYSSSSFEKCIAYVEDYMSKHGPFDGVLGFSQGAIVAGLLPHIQAKGIALPKIPKLRFVILISGAKYEDLKWGQHMLASSDCPIRCSSLHFIGEKDFYKERGIALTKSFVDPIIIHHSRGHAVPKLDEKGLETTFSFIDKIQKMISLDFSIKSAL